MQLEIQDSFRASPLAEHDHDPFVSWVTEEIPKNYDDIDHSFAESIFTTHLRGSDSRGFFTKRKTIWGLYDDAGLVGFNVITEKRGGSVKSGPLILAPSIRRQGVGSDFKKEVVDYYRRAGSHKAYATVSSRNSAAMMMNLRLGWDIEAVLSNQHGEAVIEAWLTGVLPGPREQAVMSSMVGEQGTTPAS